MKVTSSIKMRIFQGKGLGDGDRIVNERLSMFTSVLKCKTSDFFKQIV